MSARGCHGQVLNAASGSSGPPTARYGGRIDAATAPECGKGEHCVIIARCGIGGRTVISVVCARHFPGVHVVNPHLRRTHSPIPFGEWISRVPGAEPNSRVTNAAQFA